MQKVVLTFIILVTYALILHSAPVKDGPVTAELVPEYDSILPGSEFYIALRLMPDEGWHTYWRYAGDTGMPPGIEWELPEGFSASKILWPYPEKVSFSNMADYAYKRDVLLLTKIKAPDVINNETIEIKATAKWLVCKEKCIPGKAGLELSLAVSEKEPEKSKWAGLFEEEKSRLPLNNIDWNFHAEREEEAIFLYFSPDDGAAVAKVIFFPYQSQMIDNGERQFLLRNSAGYVLNLQMEPMRSKAPERLKGILVYRTEDDPTLKSIEIDEKIIDAFSE